MELTKWPRLLVKGSPVTQEQANDILIKTNQWGLLDYGSNDKEWIKIVKDIVYVYGYPAKYKEGDVVSVREYYQEMDSWVERVGILNLSYLNNYRIMSSWVGGPHGWCNWDGTVGCANYNLGKWPSTEEVHDDWCKIAEAFPYLSLKAQLVPDEGEYHRPAVEWIVKDGGVTLIENPTEKIVQPRPLSDVDFISSIFWPEGERGVSKHRLAEALAQVFYGK